MGEIWSSVKHQVEVDSADNVLLFQGSRLGERDRGVFFSWNEQTKCICQRQECVMYLISLAFVLTVLHILKKKKTIKKLIKRVMKQENAHQCLLIREG